MSYTTHSSDASHSLESLSFLPQTRLQAVVNFCLVSLSYYLFGALALEVVTIESWVTPIWAAAGIGYAALFLWGYRFGFAIFIGEMFEHIFLMKPLSWLELLTASSNTLSLLIGVWLVRYLLRQPQSLFSRPAHVGIFCGSALLISLLSASLGISLRLLFNTIHATTPLQVWWTWGLADLVGILVIAPFIITGYTEQKRAWYSHKRTEIILLFTSLSLVVWLVFGHSIDPSISAYPLTFLLMPFPLWAVFRFGQRETLFVIVVMSTIAILATLSQSGPFTYHSLDYSLLILQAFIGVICISTLILMAVVNQRSVLETQLLASQAALQDANNRLEQKVLARTESLRQSMEKYQAIFINAIEGIYQTTPEGKILEANPALAQMYGYASPEEMMEKVPDIEVIYINAERRAEFHQQLQETKAVYNFESEVYRHDGDIMWISENSRLVQANDGRVLYYEGTMIDITERKQVEEELLQLAHYDPLTGLANRRLFQARLKQVMAKARSSGKTGVLLYFDLDGFKKVNDTLGHEFGDYILQEAAKRLKNCLRDRDVSCRLGGDEFTVIAEQVMREQDAVTIAEKILANLTKPYIYKEQEASIGVSIGITFFDGHNYDIENIVKQADNAMYSAKRSGKGTYRFYTQTSEDIKQQINNKII
ncbi:PAS domain S-box/diguanylate cyclase (GGDEF) domain-containing protein [Beggiatoa alba B18LD]|uniref:PAS domain S-box/diguanylate cyclase (GGDEF) domain-containing protein n=1 Tax=Beggiatoa alba B18LD TaxID=395493 RepID=I3CHQ2_9GAMM|nr:diguanylate cyclase [Beggiatoa alba]EIJ43145.1 PAS domain S-box/diguanylate cyclase (GGDEF) domain-containing protein [Beggiatoa alba B18LD]